MSDHVSGPGTSAVPAPTARVRFREMTAADLDAMSALLGDPEVMAHYPRPKSREEAQAWIDWNQRNYAEHGFGLWIIETHDGDFIGDCGLTWQEVDGERHLEVGYHVAPRMQRLGYGSEAARACLEHAMSRLGASHVVAIIRPANTPSRRLAESIGMTLDRETSKDGLPVAVYAMRRSAATIEVEHSCE